MTSAHLTINRNGRIALILAAALLAATAAPARADDTGAVVGTVSAAVQAPCITIGASALDFGTNAFSPTDAWSSGVGLVDGGEEFLYPLTNCGDSEQTILARGTDASSTASSAVWTLIRADPDVIPVSPCVDGANAYWMFTQVEDPANPGSGTQEFLASDVDVALPHAGRDEDPVPAGESRNVLDVIFMPCVGSDGAGEPFELTIMYTAVVG